MSYSLNPSKGERSNRKLADSTASSQSSARKATVQEAASTEDVESSISIRRWERISGKEVHQNSVEPADGIVEN